MYEATKPSIHLSVCTFLYADNSVCVDPNGTHLKYKQYFEESQSFTELIVMCNYVGDLCKIFP